MRIAHLPKTVLVLLFLSSIAIAQEEQPTETVKEELTKILRVQANCWNEDDIEGFMQTYWNSEELTFSSGGKTTKGWQATLDGYKERYPAGNMGRLHFDHLDITLLGGDAALVLGQWHLTYDAENKDGNFSLVLRKLEGGWKIVHDHSSIIEPSDDKSDS